MFENVPNENCSLLTEKKTKSQRQNEPENPPRKKKRKGKIERTRRKKVGEEKKKEMAALLVFMLTFLKEKNCLRGELYFSCNVIQKSSFDIYFS